MNSLYIRQKTLGVWQSWSRDDMVYLLNEVRTAHLDRGRVGHNDFGLVAEALAIAIVAMEMGRTEEGIGEIVSKVSRVAYTASLIADGEDFSPELRARLGIADIACYRGLPVSKAREVAETYEKELPPRRRKRRRPTSAVA